MRPTPWELLLAKACDLLTLAIHQCIYCSSVYPKELFEDVAMGAFGCKQSRHPDLNTYISDTMRAVRLLLAQASFQAVTVRVVDGQAVVAEWVLDVRLDAALDAHTLGAWVGSIVTRMPVLAGRIPPSAGDRTFQVHARLATALATYRFGHGGRPNDWVLADTDPAALASTIHPLRSFRHGPAHVPHPAANGDCLCCRSMPFSRSTTASRIERDQLGARRRVRHVPAAAARHILPVRRLVAGLHVRAQPCRRLVANLVQPRMPAR